jgi:polysaccharide biosynthesis transport protein
MQRISRSQEEVLIRPSEGVTGVAPPDLRGLLGGLLRRWKLIIAVPTILLAGTAALLKIVPRQYQASVELLAFDPQQVAIATPGQQSTSDHDLDADTLTTELNTEIAVIQSASIALRVVKDLDLAKNAEFQRHSRLDLLLGGLGLSRNGRVAVHLRALFAVLGLDSAEGAVGRDQFAALPTAVEADPVATAAALLHLHISVDRVPFSYVLSISGKSRSAEMAQRLAAKVVDDYLAGLREQRQQGLQQLAVWLKPKLADLKTRIAETESSIETMKAKSGLSDTGNGNVAEGQIADLNAQLMLARTEAAQKRAQLDQAGRLARTGAGLQDISDDPISSMVGQLRQQQSQLLAREARLRSELGDLNPEVLAIAAELAGVNKAINQESAHILANLHNSYDIALRRERSLEASLQRLTSAQSSSGNYVKLQQLQRIVDADSKLYNSYLTQYDEIDARESLQAFGPRIISPASVPTVPSFPPVKLLYLSAVVLGLGAGVALALLLDYFQARIKTSAQAQSSFGHPVVGALPLMKRPRLRGPDKIGSLVRAVVDAPMSPLSEAVRAVRISLHLANPDRASMVVLVTSSLPGEGKSSIAMLLAASSAGAGQSTVVVDCDLRSRTISRQFDALKPGLTDVLTGNANLAAVALPHPIARCDVITAGSRSDTPADLLVSRRLAEIIAHLRERYAYIIVDAPPLLAAIDAIALATVADKILIAIDGTRTRSQSVAESFRLLGPETDRVAGMVFNKVAPGRFRSYAAGVYY